MNWKAYRDSSGATYLLDHLHDSVIAFQLPMTTTRPAQSVGILVTYSLHCFTRSPRDGEGYLLRDVYYRNPEGRLFCSDRWTLSLGLPDIIRSLPNRNCFKTDRKNHVLFSKGQTENGDEYAVFFVVRRKANAAQPLTINILSAHARTGFRPNTKPTKGRDIIRSML